MSNICVTCKKCYIYIFNYHLHWTIERNKESVCNTWL